MAVPVARLLVVADAFVAELNDLLASWGVTTPALPVVIPPNPPLPVLAVRKYSVEYAIDDLSVLHVDVQAVTLEEDIQDRNGRTKNYGINVVVQQQVTTADNAAPEVIDGVLVIAEASTAAITERIDRLVDLVVGIFENWKLEDIVEGLPSVALISSGGLTNSGVMVYSPVLLTTQGRFFGQITFVFTEATL